jgi:hypothetical protein
MGVLGRQLTKAARRLEQSNGKDDPDPHPAKETPSRGGDAAIPIHQQLRVWLRAVFLHPIRLGVKTVVGALLLGARPCHEQM